MQIISHALCLINYFFIVSFHWTNKIWRDGLEGAKMDNLSNKYKYITDMEVINGKLYWRLGEIVLFFLFSFSKR